MKANILSCKDLMIGDWVYNPFTRKTLRLTFGRDLDLVEELCLEPIPLTAEILEKNGWKYEFDKDDYMVKYDLHKKGKDCWMMWSIKKHNLDVQRQDEHLDVYNLKVSRVVIPCDFVHQLQHALRLCGIEKEIIL